MQTSGRWLSSYQLSTVSYQEHGSRQIIDSVLARIFPELVHASWRVGQLLVERLPIFYATAQELWPRGNTGKRVALLR
jgi:hypothetical protein